MHDHMASGWRDAIGQKISPFGSDYSSMCSPSCCSDMNSPVSTVDARFLAPSNQTAPAESEPIDFYSDIGADLLTASLTHDLNLIFSMDTEAVNFGSSKSTKAAKPDSMQPSQLPYLTNFSAKEACAECPSRPMTLQQQINAMRVGYSGEGVNQNWYDVTPMSEHCNPASGFEEVFYYDSGSSSFSRPFLDAPHRRQGQLFQMLDEQQRVEFARTGGRPMGQDCSCSLTMKSICEHCQGMSSANAYQSTPYTPDPLSAGHQPQSNSGVIIKIEPPENNEFPSPTLGKSVPFRKLSQPRRLSAPYEISYYARPHDGSSPSSESTLSPFGSPPAVQLERKRWQNREAALRYRQKKKQERETKLEELCHLESQNKNLLRVKATLEIDIAELRSCLAEFQKF